MNVTDDKVLFWGSIFSNFAHTPYEAPDGKRFHCSEQEFMYRKACLFDDYNIANRIMQQRDPANCKMLGRQVKGFNQKVWDEVCYDVMYNACRNKFTYSKKAYEALMSYPGKIFVEASPEDRIWGIGLAEYDRRALDESKWRGKNLLGKVLTQIRDEIQSGEIPVDVANLY